MIDYYLSLTKYEQFLFFVAIISGVVFVVNLCIERCERHEQGISPKRGQSFSVLTAMSTLCLFCVLTLLFIRNGIRWYMAYPVSIIIIIVYVFLVLIIFGRTKKIRRPKTDYRIAIGRTGVVFKPIESDTAKGCVSVDAFGDTIEAYAISADGEPIISGTVIKVIDIDDDVLVCIPLTPNSK